MFTGIVQEMGTVARIERPKGLTRLTIAAPKTAARVHPLDSVSVSGVCLTAVHVRQGALVFEVIHETRRLTTLGALRGGAQVNLEPSLSMVDRLGGHLLFGHVDGVAAVARRRQLPGALMLELRAGPALRRFLVPKGPVAVEGVGLTVGQRLGPSTFTIHLIPETLRQTTLGSRRVGDRVNVEIDYLAKLVAHFLRSRLHGADAGG